LLFFSKAGSSRSYPRPQILPCPPFLRSRQLDLVPSLLYSNFYCLLGSLVPDYRFQFGGHLFCFAWFSLSSCFDLACFFSRFRLDERRLILNREPFSPSFFFLFFLLFPEDTTSRILHATPARKNSAPLLPMPPPILFGQDRPSMKKTLPPAPPLLCTITPPPSPRTCDRCSFPPLRSVFPLKKSPREGPWLAALLFCLKSPIRVPHFFFFGLSPIVVPSQLSFIASVCFFLFCSRFFPPSSLFVFFFSPDFFPQWRPFPPFCFASENGFSIYYIPKRLLSSPFPTVFFFFFFLFQTGGAKDSPSTPLWLTDSLPCSCLVMCFFLLILLRVASRVVLLHSPILTSHFFFLFC